MRTLCTSLFLALPVFNGLGQLRPIPDPDVVVTASEVMRESVGNANSKSVFLAVGLSLVLPGMGEWYANNFQVGRYFLAADGALWLTYAGFVLHGDWVRGDARSFATQHSGAYFGGKDDRFEVNIGNFNSTDAYNQAKLRNREFELLYSDPNSVWNWNSESSRLRYRSLRIKSDELYQSSRIVIGAIVINRIISAFSAWRSAASYNRSRASDEAWRIFPEIQGGFHRAHGISLKFLKEF